MVPSMYVPIASVPRTPNGKLDRRRMHKAIGSLSKSRAARYSLVDTAKKAPQTDTEAMLHNLWCSVLSMAPEAIGTNDSFFRLGGDSICAIKLVAAAREQGMSLSVPVIFKSPRLSEMALAMSKVKESGEYTDTVVEDRPFDLLPAGMSTSTEQIRAEVAEQCSIAASSIVDLYPCTPFQDGPESVPFYRKRLQQTPISIGLEISGGVRAHSSHAHCFHQRCRNPTSRY
jgi:aryl carrier-like protein